MTTSPIILAIDTATGPCSAAIWRDGKIASYQENLRTVTQSVSLMPLIEAALKESGTTYKELTCVAATIGPGSFTGIRVGLAAARAICFSAGIKGIGVTTLDVLAFGAGQQQSSGQALAILNAGKGEWYYRSYALPAGAPTCHICLGTLEQAQACVPSSASVAGNIPGERAISFPRADLLAALVAEHGEHVGGDMHPFYLRAPDAKLPEKKIV